MSQTAGQSWRARAGALAMLLPVLFALAGCGNRNQEMTDKLAAAQTAADRAVAAQHAAERAAANAANARAAPAAPVEVSNSLTDSDEGEEPNDGDNQDDDSGPELSMGGPGQTVSADGTVIPGV